jgi:hypothetical protein
MLRGWLPYAGIVQEYLLKLLGGYRRFICPDIPRSTAVQPSSRRAQSVGSSGGGSAHASPRQVLRESSLGRSRTSHGLGSTEDTSLKAAGYVFDHAAFVRSHRCDCRVSMQP